MRLQNRRSVYLRSAHIPAQEGKSPRPHPIDTGPTRSIPTRIGMIRMIVPRISSRSFRLTTACATCNNAADAYACSCAASYRRAFSMATAA
ncbi:MAG: hypothetical protein MZV64_24280 [Ignavibacteriales bacterium]|nr:hypothetical protein [Ignavibacteriales bacterium]